MGLNRKPFVWSLPCKRYLDRRYLVYVIIVGPQRTRIYSTLVYVSPNDTPAIETYCISCRNITGIFYYLFWPMDMDLKYQWDCFQGIQFRNYFSYSNILLTKVSWKISSEKMNSKYYNLEPPNRGERAWWSIPNIFRYVQMALPRYIKRVRTYIPTRITDFVNCSNSHWNSTKL